MSDLEHPDAHRPYPVGASDAVPADELRVAEARAQVLSSEASGSERSAERPWFHQPAAVKVLAFGPSRRPHPPTPAETARSKLPRASDDALLTAVEGFATLILTTADLPYNVSSLSLDELLNELRRRGLTSPRTGRLTALSGEVERLNRLSDREAALEEPPEGVRQLRKVLSSMRDELARRLERMLRRNVS